MGFATHLGPWLLGTVKNTTGTTAGTIRNIGATVVAQTIPVTFQTFTNSLTGTLGAIPAGSLITGVQIITSTAFSSATTLVVTIGGVDVAASASTITALGVINVTLAGTFASTAANVGTTDDLITYTATGSALTTGAATIVISYVVRNGDGAANPTSTQN
jgi:hypothetical protein